MKKVRGQAISVEQRGHRRAHDVNACGDETNRSLAAMAAAAAAAAG